MAILITGGLGYIGSHIAKITQEQEDVIILDNLSNSNLNFSEILPNAKVIIDDVSYKSTSNIFKEYEISSVIHLAGYKSVSDSIKNPVLYYENNILPSIELLKSMIDNNINNLVFSSSATVYGSNTNSPLKEEYKTEFINPYGHSKIIIEEMIKECCISYDNFNAISLRYFNPIGAHFEGKLGDKPLGKPLNLMPLIVQAAKGNKLQIFGNNYSTPDGTCIRDYIHVLDLARAHLVSIKFLKKCKYDVFNIGLGRGISVLELIEIFQNTNNILIDYNFTKKRKGDSAVSFADNSKALKILKWKPEYNYEDMCRDSWRSFS